MQIFLSFNFIFPFYSFSTFVFLAISFPFFLFFSSSSFKLKHARTRPGWGTNIVLTPLRRYTLCYHFHLAAYYDDFVVGQIMLAESRWERLKEKVQLVFNLFYLLWLCYTKLPPIWKSWKCWIQINWSGQKQNRADLI